MGAHADPRWAVAACGDIGRTYDAALEAAWAAYETSMTEALRTYNAALADASSAYNEALADALRAAADEEHDS